MKNQFLLIDNEKNLLLIPADNPNLADLIHHADLSKVVQCQTAGELTTYVKNYLKSGTLDEQ